MSLSSPVRRSVAPAVGTVRAQIDLATQSTHLQASGALGTNSSNLHVAVNTGNLSEWSSLLSGFRGTAVSLFASALFMGQSVGVLLAAALVERIGSGAVIALGGGIMFAVGAFFSQALRRRDELMHLE